MKDAHENDWNSVIILDDLVTINNQSRKFISELYMSARHKGFSVIELRQRIFSGNEAVRTQRLNCTQYMLFQIGGDEVLRLLRQIEPSEKRAELTFKRYEFCTEKKYGYLFIDLTQTVKSKWRYRDSSLSECFAPN